MFIIERLDTNNKVRYLNYYGCDPIAYSTIQDDLIDIHIDGKGYVSYTKCLNYNFVLGNPICAQKDYYSFLSEAINQLNFPAFVQVNRTIASILESKFGYNITPFGVEVNIPLQIYNLDNDIGKRNLRSYLRKGLSQGEVMELSLRELYDRYKITTYDLQNLSSQWMSMKSAKSDLKFLLRNVVFHDEPGVRKFYSFDSKNSLLGYCFFNPIYRNNNIIGYCADIMRTSSGASKGHASYIVLKAMEKFKEEGKELLSLGLSPRSFNYSKELGYSKSLNFYLNASFKYGSRFYNFKGIDENKRQYRGIEETTYIATKGRVSILRFIAFMHCMGLF